METEENDIDWLYRKYRQMSYLLAIITWMILALSLLVMYFVYEGKL